MNRLHRPARTALAGSTLAVLALGLTACGGDDDAQAAPAPATVTVTEDAEAPTELDLSEDDGRILWEVGSDERTSVLIDAGSGDVVGTDTDD